MDIEVRNNVVKHIDEMLFDNRMFDEQQVRPLISAISGTMYNCDYSNELQSLIMGTNAAFIRCEDNDLQAFYKGAIWGVLELFKQWQLDECEAAQHGELLHIVKEYETVMHCLYENEGISQTVLYKKMDMSEDDVIKALVALRCHCLICISIMGQQRYFYLTRVGKSICDELFENNAE